LEISDFSPRKTCKTASGGDRDPASPYIILNTFYPGPADLELLKERLSIKIDVSQSFNLLKFIQN